MMSWFRKKRIDYYLVFPKLRGLLGELSSSEIVEMITSPKMATSLDRLPQTEIAYCLWAIAASLKIVSANRKRRFSVVHAFGYRFDGLAALIASRIIRTPYSVHIKGPGIHLKDLLPSKTQRFLRRLEYPLNLLVLRKADLVLCESEEGRHSLYVHIGKSIKIQLSPPPIQTKEYKLPVEIRQEMRRKFCERSDTVLIGYVGRLDRGKNVGGLIRAYNSARKYLASSKLVIVGTGPLDLELRRLARNLGIESEVILLGRRYDVPALLQAIDIFVIPSFFEGYSNALLEAMAAGKAIVASDIPGNREILGSDWGFFFNPTDLHALERLLVELGGNLGLRTACGVRANRLAGKYDLDTVCDDFLQKLSSVVIKSEAITSEVSSQICGLK
jgi:glycosyltransferase involved in cell wall biosynthesis